MNHSEFTVDISLFRDLTQETSLLKRSERSNAPFLNFQYLVTTLRSSSKWLTIRPRLPLISILPFTFHR